MPRSRLCAKPRESWPARSAERLARSQASSGLLPKKLFEKAPSGCVGKEVRLPVCQDDHASLRAESHPKGRRGESGRPNVDTQEVVATVLRVAAQRYGGPFLRANQSVTAAALREAESGRAGSCRPVISTPVLLGGTRATSIFPARPDRTLRRVTSEKSPATSMTAPTWWSPHRP
jgi:hypothetical protein